MPLQRFSPPAYIQDLNEELQDAWSNIIDNWYQEAFRHLREDFSIAQPYLFNLLEHPEAENGPVREIPWNGFPRKYQLVFPNLDDRWRMTEAVVNTDLNGRYHPYAYRVNGRFVRATDIFFRDQDEYCEWKSFYNLGSNELQKIVFTCENPEYWSFIAEAAPQLLLEKYREITGENVMMEDLYFNKDIFYPREQQYVNQNGRYNPHNKWNSTHGIMHLSHPANSLAAEIYLAAEATIIRTDSRGSVITEDKSLICCAGYGSPNRFSDPTIGSRINTLVRNNISVTINDPVGLYIHSLDAGSIEFPQGILFEDCWKVVRGQENMILRAEFSLPVGSGLRMEDILVGGHPLKYGSQLAEYINMVIYGKGFNFQLTDPASKGCTAHCCTIPAFPTLVMPIDINMPCTPTPENMIFSNPLEVFEMAEAAGEVEFTLKSIGSKKFLNKRI